MYARILYATLTLIWRTLAFPYFVCRNLIMLRKHRKTYKKLNSRGNERFSESSPELDEKRSRLVQDSFAHTISRYRNSISS